MACVRVVLSRFDRVVKFNGPPHLRRRLARPELNGCENEMVLFQVNNDDKFLSTNMKVMYSSLLAQPNLTPVGRGKHIEERLKQLIWRRESSRVHYLLVRNPYSRTISFFQDKFRFNLKRGRKSRLYAEWQKCQKLFFPHAGVKKNDRYEEIVDKLLSFEFPNFIELLPELWRMDDHLIPQCCVFLGRIKFVMRSNLFSNIIRMENRDELNSMATELNIDLGMRRNTTAPQAIGEWFTPDQYKIINSVYEDDFNQFNYQMR